jgi:hypothetical protein
VGGRQGADALGHVRQDIARPGILDAARLEQDQRGDHLEVVLDPMVKLLEERRFMVERRLKRIGAPGHLRLDRLL